MPRKRRNPGPDIRHTLFIDFAFTTYRQEREGTLVIDGRSVRAVADMLKATHAHMEEFSIDVLERAWIYFLQNSSDFDRSQPPLIWFARNLNRWVAECNGSKKAASQNIARAWVEDRLGKDRHEQ